MEPTSITGVVAGYELYSGCSWSGIYMVWYLEEFVDIDLSSASILLARNQMKPQKKQEQLKCLKKVFVFLSKSEYDRANSTL